MVFSSMRALRVFLRAQAVVKFVLRVASTLENTTGEQRALRKYFPLAEKPQALFLLLNAPSNLSDTSTIRDTFASYLESDPGYGMYNCVNLCYCRVL